VPLSLTFSLSFSHTQIQALERTVCTGSISEMRTTGGEVAFICAMIADSLYLRER
jgi:hypothetical protein